MLYRISAVIVRFFLRTFFKLEIEGADCFPKRGPFILASNHASFLDPPTVASCSPRKLSTIARDDLFNNKILGFYMKRVGAIPLKRDSADIGALKQALRILKTSPLLLFPQGGRTTDLGKAKAGIGFLCRKAGVPVIAVRVYGTDVVLPKGAKFFRKGKIKVIFSKVDNIEKNDTNEGITSKVMERIKSL
tara:strand:- start:581 stop:1150 length:570 start_codon:yes stop_codon:yes gene_type:complete